MGLFGDKDKLKVKIVGKHRYLIRAGKRAGSLPDEGESKAPEPSSLNMHPSSTHASRASGDPDYYKNLAESSGVMNSLFLGKKGTPIKFLDASNFRDCDPQAILNNIDLLMIAQTMDPKANLKVTDNGVEIKVGDADFPGNKDYRVVINLNYLDLFTVQKVLVEKKKYTLKGIVDNINVSDLDSVARDAAMYKNNPFFGE